MDMPLGPMPQGPMPIHAQFPGLDVLQKLFLKMGLDPSLLSKYHAAALIPLDMYIVRWLALRPTFGVLLAATSNLAWLIVWCFTEYGLTSSVSACSDFFIYSVLGYGHHRSSFPWRTHNKRLVCNKTLWQTHLR